MSNEEKLIKAIEGLEESEEVDLDNITVTTFEISIVRRRLLDLVLKYIHATEKFWRFLQRKLHYDGIDVVASIKTYYKDNKVYMVLEVELPDDLVIDMAKRFKRRILMFGLRTQKQPREEKKFEFAEKEFEREEVVARKEIKFSEETERELDEIVKELEAESEKNE